MYLNAFFFSMAGFFFSLPISNTFEGTFSIKPGSQLYLEGTSNVTDFSCDCHQDFTDLRFEYIPCEEDSEISFHQTSLKIKSKQLDCGHAGMNKDMHETLKADEYPEIQIELIKLNLPRKSTIRNFHHLTVSATIALTISGVRKEILLSVDTTPLDCDQYQLKSWHPICLSDFGLTTPSPLFGLVKVSDIINIYFDLQVQLHL